MRARGLVAVLGTGVLATAPRWGAGTLVVATSASGGSVETLDALGRLPPEAAHSRVDEHRRLGDHRAVRRRRRPRAETEAGGVACRSYQHTLALLMALECHLTGADTGALAASVAAAADGERAPTGYRSGLAPAGFRAAARAVRHPSGRAGAPVLFGAAGRADAARGTTPGRGRMRDRRLEPRRRVSDEDDRLPTAGLRRIGVGSPAGRVDHAARQHRGRRRRATCPGARLRTCAIPATRTTTSGCSPRCWCPNSSPPARGRLSGCRPRHRWGIRHRAS